MLITVPWVQGHHWKGASSLQSRGQGCVLYNIKCSGSTALGPSNPVNVCGEALLMLRATLMGLRLRTGEQTMLTLCLLPLLWLTKTFVSGLKKNVSTSIHVSSKLACLLISSVRISASLQLFIEQLLKA